MIAINLHRKGSSVWVDMMGIHEAKAHLPRNPGAVIARTEEPYWRQDYPHRNCRNGLEWMALGETPSGKGEQVGQQFGQLTSDSL